MLSWGSQFCDVNGDAWPDLVVAGDFETSRLFWNNRDGTFSDGTEVAEIGGEEVVRRGRVARLLPDRDPVGSMARIIVEAARRIGAIGPVVDNCAELCIWIWEDGVLVDHECGVDCFE